MKKFLYFLGGIAIGLAIGILIAPNDGKQTREKLIRELRDILEGLLKRRLEDHDKGRD